MSDTKVAIFNADGQSAFIDYRTEATNGEGRQVIVLGDQSINANIAAIQQTDPASNTQGLVVRDVNTSAIASFLAGTLGVYLNSTAGTLNMQLKPGTIAVSLDPGHLLGAVTANAGTGSFSVQFDPGHELGSIKQINSTVGVYVDSTQGTLAVQFKAGTLAVQLDPGHQIGNIGSLVSITNTVAVYFDRGNPSVNATFSSTSLEVVPTTGSRKITDDASASQRVLIVGSQSNASLVISGTVTANAGSGTMNVQFDPGHTLGAITTLNSITTTVNVALDPGHTIGIVGDQSTLVIPITTAGSTSGVSVSGVALAGPTASRVLKVFAFSLTTTAQTSLTAKFTNGAGTSPTVFYEAALQAPAQGISGTNMAVTPPGYLFATTSGATLALLLDSASKVHYFVSYFEESA